MAAIDQKLIDRINVLAKKKKEGHIYIIYIPFIEYI